MTKKKPTQKQLLKLWRDAHRTGTGVKRVGKRIVRTNPFSPFKKYYVTCDGKKFGPYSTMAKAKKVAETVARVLDKPAKILGQAGAATNPRKIKSKAKPKLKRKRNFHFFPRGVKERLKRKTKRAVDLRGYSVVDKDGVRVHTGWGLNKTEALKMAKQARAAGDKGVRVIKDWP